VRCRRAGYSTLASAGADIKLAAVYYGAAGMLPARVLGWDGLTGRFACLYLFAAFAAACPHKYKRGFAQNV
jgi:hypothetical protein